MPFPESPRIIFRKNPLDSVVCQIRFPTILKIESEPPAEFQDRVREEYPNFEETLGAQLEARLKLGEAPPSEFMGQLAQLATRKNYQFGSEDGSWKVNLTRDFIALTAQRYERWEQFRAKLQGPLDTLVNVYEPPYFSRIGLRYIDVIKRSVLNLANVEWKELLRPEILGVLASHDIGGHVRSFESKSEIRLSDEDSIVRVITGFAEAIDDKELCYLIDSDFFTERKTPAQEALNKLDYFSIRGSRLFQWCITRRLYDAMEAQPI